MAFMSGLPPGYNFPKDTSESHFREIEDLENKINVQSRNLLSLKQICEDLYKKVASLEAQIHHLSTSAYMTAIELDKKKKTPKNDGSKR
jgi:hypothetical protein